MDRFKIELIPTRRYGWLGWLRPGGWALCAREISTGDIVATAFYKTKHDAIVAYRAVKADE